MEASKCVIYAERGGTVGGPWSVQSLGEATPESLPPAQACLLSRAPFAYLNWVFSMHDTEIHVTVHFTTKTDIKGKENIR